jgi:hypothetical protein
LPEDIIIAKGYADPRALIAMATHARSGITRWLLGSVAEKILRGASNALLLIKATERANTEGRATVKSIIVPLDGSSALVSQVYCCLYVDLFTSLAGEVSLPA